LDHVYALINRQIINGYRSSELQRIWQEELISIATEPERQKELDKNEEIHIVADIIKAVYYQEYKNDK
jgi:hypothetical protein